MRGAWMAMVGVLVARAPCAAAASAPAVSPAPGSAVARSSAASSPTAAATPVARPVPTPEHVVVVVFENKDTDQVLGSGEAPFLDELARAGANFVNAHAEAH